MKMEDVLEYMVVTMLACQVLIFVILNLPFLQGVKQTLIKFLIFLNRNYYANRLRYLLLLLSLLLFAHSYWQQNEMRDQKNHLKEQGADLTKAQSRLSWGLIKTYINFANLLIYLILLRFTSLLQSYFKIRQQQQLLQNEKQQRLKIK